MSKSSKPSPKARSLARVVFASTRAISSTGGYNLEDYAPELDLPKGAQIIDGPVQARKAAREQLDHGADWIKVYMNPPFVDRQTRPPGLATHANGGRIESHCR